MFVILLDEKIPVRQFDLRQLTFADLLVELPILAGGTLEYSAHRPTIRLFF